MRAAILLLALAAASQAEERYRPEDLAAAARYVEAHPDFGSRFARRWEEALGELSSLKEHRDFVLRKKSIRLRIEDPKPGAGISRDTAVAAYKDGGLYLNRVALVLEAHNLESIGVPHEQTPEILAWKFLSTLAHEIRHGIIQQELEARAGFFTPILLEDEVLASFDEVVVLKEAIAARSRFWEKRLLLHIDKENGTLLADWARPGGLERNVRERYPAKVSALEIGREGLLRELEEEERRLKGILRDTETARRILASARTAAEREAARKYLDTPPGDAEVRRMVEANRRAREGVADPRRWKIFSDYMRRRVDALRREWRRQHP